MLRAQGGRDTNWQWKRTSVHINDQNATHWPNALPMAHPRPQSPPTSPGSHPPTTTHKPPSSHWTTPIGIDDMADKMFQCPIGQFVKILANGHAYFVFCPPGPDKIFTFCADVEICLILGWTLMFREDRKSSFRP